MLNSVEDHAQLYPTLARIALDVLPCQASSVPCERLFSASKQTADYRRASLGAKHFEELQVMKFAWRKNVNDLATWNSTQIEEVDLDEYSEMLEAEDATVEFDNVLVGKVDGFAFESTSD
jgi:hAT family C-terminal dimerisation region